MAKYSISETRKTILTALLLATFIILDRLLTINTQFLAINLSLIPIMLAGMILGWKQAILVGALRRYNWFNFLAFWSVLSRFYF